MTSRRLWLIGLAALGACGPGREPAPPQLSKQVGTWTLVSGPVSGPAGWVYQFSGTPEITLTLKSKGVETLAFDALQKWRPEAGKLAFYKGRYFGLAESSGANHRTLSEFVTAVQTVMPAR